MATLHTDQSDIATAAHDRLKAIVGARGWIDDQPGMAPYLAEWRGLYHGRAAAVVCPGSTADVAAVVRVCADAGICIVPQGGNTGLVGGAAPHDHGDEIILSTRRLNAVRDIDTRNDTITVEAGVVLQAVQQAAADADRLFPLSLGAEGSCQIGGTLSTNAGGTAVLRYGNMRDLTLGLEVVLPDGSVWDGLRGLRKDNSGYDLKQLFIGAEGTLGIITAATLKLFPRPRQRQTALVAVADPAAAIELLDRARTACGDSLTAIELIPRLGIDFALRHVEGAVDPLADRYDWYALVELTSPTPGDHLRDALEALLETAFEDGMVADATIAASEGQAGQLWFLREAIVEGQRFEGGGIKHDVAVPISRVAEFIAQATEAVLAQVPGTRIVAFGHLGDGNIHFNLSQPPDMAADAFVALWHDVSHRVHDIAVALGGTISAEHGIGRLKRDELAERRSTVEIDLMRRIKRTIDPAGIMNPGKIL